MVDDIPKKQCKRCKNVHPETLYSDEIDGLCVYCKADDVDALPSPATTEQAEPDTEELSVEE